MKSKTEIHFDNIANDYENSNDGNFCKPFYNEILKRILNEDPKSVLDLGCGTGIILRELEEEENIKLSGLDISAEMVKVAQMNTGADIKKGDAENIPFDDNSFDLVVCNASFHHYRNPRKVIQEIKRVLNKNGVLILGDPYLSSIVRFITNIFIKFSDNGDYRIYNQKEIEELLTSEGFECNNFKLIEKDKFCLNSYLK